MNNNKDQRPRYPHRRFWILGAGRFGQIAVNRIRQRFPDARIVVVDQDPPPSGIEADTLIHADGIDWLVRNLDHEARVDIVVPAIPVHVAAGWLRQKLSPRFTSHPIDIPDALIAMLPNAMRGKPGQAFVSHADFICPDNCPEPRSICTHTGKPRPTDLFRILDAVRMDDFVPVVLRSHQLLPGVGGILPADLFGALEKAIAHAGHPLMLATACRCHGVVDCMRLAPKSR